jgi:lysophospholipase L1-like esterase
MSIEKRKYVGARYVPLFSTPLEWSNTREYEPLTIVLNEGNSYTSRQFVPLGIDISNESYWALTGNYDAQVEQYRQEVQAFDGRITTNETNIAALQKTAGATRHFTKGIAIGDSWGTGTYSGSEHPADGWPAKLKTMLGIDMINACVGGQGFVTGSQTFLTQLQNVDQSYRDADIIVVLGGQNDGSNHTEAELDQAVYNFFSYATQTYPNAEIHFFPMARAFNGPMFDNLDGERQYAYPETYAGMMSGAQRANLNGNVYVHEGCYRWGQGFGESNSDPDHIHLLPNGYTMCAAKMHELIWNGGDWWPTLLGKITVTTSALTVIENRIIEKEGMVTLSFMANAVNAYPINNKMAIPEFCRKANGNTKVGCVPGGKSCFNFNQNLITCVVEDIPAGATIAMNYSWKAGF